MATPLNQELLEILSSREKKGSSSATSATTALLPRVISRDTALPALYSHSTFVVASALVVLALGLLLSFLHFVYVVMVYW